MLFSGGLAVVSQSTLRAEATLEVEWLNLVSGHVFLLIFHCPRRPGLPVSRNGSISCYYHQLSTSQASMPALVQTLIQGVSNLPTTREASRQLELTRLMVDESLANNMGFSRTYVSYTQGTTGYELWGTTL